MKIISILILCLFINSCIGTENYYKAQTEYYKAQAEANKAYTLAISKPLAQMQSPDGTTFIVNNPNIQKPEIHQAVNPITDGIKTIVNSTPAAILSSGFAVKEIVKHSSNIQNNGGTVTTNSNNSTKLLNEGNLDESVKTDNTHTPTVVSQEKAVIVEQDKAIIVKPEVIENKPIIVQPEIITIGE